MDVKGCIGREEVLCGGPVELNMGIGTVGSALNAWRGKDSCDRQWQKSRRRLSQQTGSELPGGESRPCLLRIRDSTPLGDQSYGYSAA